MIKVIPTDIYENGDLIKIAYHDLEGKFVVETVWDDNDPQDSEHRAAFRTWSYRIVSQLDDGQYEVIK